MSSTETNSNLLTQITSHCFNKDRTQVAVGVPTSILIYDCSKSKEQKDWKLLHTLIEHTGYVSSQDWNPITDQIVSCGYDRDAYVWNYDKNENKWKPTLCVLRINRAAITVRWSPSGVKFAATSGSKSVPICSYEKSSDWWISMMVKKHKSAVVDIAWAPTSDLIATASTDYKCRIISVYDKKYGEKTDRYSHIFDDKQYVFGEVLAEFDQAQAWVNAVAWSPNGSTIAFFGHGSTAHFVNLDSSKPEVETLRLSGLPICSAQFLNDTTLVGAGFDNNPIFFTYNGSNWIMKSYAETKKNPSSEATKTSSNATTRAFEMFQKADTHGSSAIADEKKDDFTTHKNVITCIRTYRDRPLEFSTSSLDRKVVCWDSSKYI